MLAAVCQILCQTLITPLGWAWGPMPQEFLETCIAQRAVTSGAKTSGSPTTRRKTSDNPLWAHLGHEDERCVHEDDKVLGDGAVVHECRARRAHGKVARDVSSGIDNGVLDEGRLDDTVAEAEQLACKKGSSWSFVVTTGRNYATKGSAVEAKWLL